MKNVIQRLYYGQLREIENTGKELPKRNSVARDKAYKLLTESFSEEQKKLFSAWEDTYGEQLCDTAEAAYIRGFKTGALFGIEIYQSRDDE